MFFLLTRHYVVFFYEYAILHTTETPRPKYMSEEGVSLNFMTRLDWMLSCLPAAEGTEVHGKKFVAEKDATKKATKTVEAGEQAGKATTICRNS